MIIKSTVVDFVIDNLNTRKQVTIISHAHEAILAFITQKLNRGATTYAASGGLYAHGSNNRSHGSFPPGSHAAA